MRADVNLPPQPCVDDGLGLSFGREPRRVERLARIVEARRGRTLTGIEGRPYRAFRRTVEGASISVFQGADVMPWTEPRGSLVNRRVNDR